MIPTPPAVQPHKVLLTFDDGPDPLHTGAVLDVLACLDVRAVFFVLGRNLESAANRAIAERAASEGHVIANHGYSHAPLTTLSDAQIQEEFRRTEMLIGDLDGGIKLWRPPFGQHDARVDAVVRSLGYTRMLWNVDTQDWLEGQESAWVRKSLHQVRQRQAHAFHNSVCLLHDNRPMTASLLGSFLQAVAALPDTRFARYAPEYPDALAVADVPPPVPALCPVDAVSFPLGDSLVVSRTGVNTIYVLNQSARFLWEDLSAGASPPEAARNMSCRYGITEDLAARDLDMALANWRMRGLLGPKPPELEDSGLWPLFADPDVASPAGGFEEEHCYRFLDSEFRIRYEPAAAAAAIHPRFLNLQAAHSSLHPATFEVFRAGQDWILRLPNGCVSCHPTVAGLSYRLFFEILQLAHPGLQPMACLHASLAGRGDGGIAFVGGNGSGKSTLAAALAGSGFRVLADDKLLLDFASARPAATPNAVSLKSGSWQVLSSQYPEISRLQTIRLGDQETVFLPVAPPRDRLLPRVTHVFFPRYSAGAETKASQLTAVEAVERITVAGGWISSDPARLHGFLEWIQSLCCYALPYSSLAAALAQIEERLPA